MPLCFYFVFSEGLHRFHGLSLNNTHSFCRARFPRACHSYLCSMIIFSFSLAAFKITSLPAASRIFCNAPFAVFLLLVASWASWMSELLDLGKLRPLFCPIVFSVLTSPSLGLPSPVIGPLVFLSVSFLPSLCSTGPTHCYMMVFSL